MAYSSETLTAPGDVREFQVSIDFLDRSDVSVTVAGVAVPSFEWISDSLIRLPTAPASGAAVRISRATGLEQPESVFVDGAVLGSDELNLQVRQLLLVAQESRDVSEVASVRVADADSKANAALSTASAALLSSQQAIAKADEVETYLEGVEASIDNAVNSANTASAAATQASADAQAAAEAASQFDPANFYTRADVDTALAGKASSSHTHSIANVTGLQGALDGKVPATRAVNTSGLATGGGALDGDRTITVPKASQVEAQAGTDDTKAMTPLRVAQAITALAAPSAFTQFYESGEQAITLGGNINLAHGLSGRPRLTRLVLRCTTAQAPFAVGDEVELGHDHTINEGAFRGFVVYFVNSTQINVSTAANAIPIVQPGGTAYLIITPASWRLIVRAWR